MDFLNLFTGGEAGPWLIVGVCFVAIAFLYRRYDKVQDKRIEDAQTRTREVVDTLNANSTALATLTEVIKAERK